jgi:ribosomal protein S18 acetylase RimI-like enzyme
MVELVAAGPGEAATLLALARVFHGEDGHPLDEGGAAAIALVARGTPHGRAWLIREGSAIVGYLVLGLGFSVEYGGVDGFLDDLYIAPEWRNRGLGSAVLGLLDAEARRLEVQAIHLEIMPGNDRAEGLHRRRGFRPSGRALYSKRLGR